MAICTWTDEETDDNVLGSGASQWEWYITAIDFHDGKYHVTMYDGVTDSTDDAKEFSFTRGKVRSTVTNMIMGKTNVNDRIRGYAKNDDMDADSMDCVIQIIAYGDVKYG